MGTWSPHPAIVEPHDRIGREVSNFMCGLPMKQGHVHLYPMAADVQRHNRLPQQQPAWVEETEHKDKASSGTPVCHHVQNSTKTGPLHESDKSTTFHRVYLGHTNEITHFTFLEIEGRNI